MSQDDAKGFRGNIGRYKPNQEIQAPQQDGSFAEEEGEPASDTDPIIIRGDVWVGWGHQPLRDGLFIMKEIVNESEADEEEEEDEEERFLRSLRLSFDSPPEGGNDDGGTGGIGGVDGNDWSNAFQ